MRNESAARYRHSPDHQERSMKGIGAGKYTLKSPRMQQDRNRRGGRKAFPGNQVSAVNTLHVRGKNKEIGRSSE
jgi:hypothetical protein